MHAANLVSELKKEIKNIQIRAWGGDKLIKEDVQLVRHIRETSVMGFYQVLKNINLIRKNLAFCKKDILTFKPDAIVLIDYPGFNLRIAKFAKKNAIKVYYYIPPKVWAWNENRINKIRKYVDHLLVVFPFEEEYYKSNSIRAEYVGNPIFDEIKKKRPPFSYKIDKPIIALLPGSRKQEIDKILDKMLSVVNDFKDYQFIIGCTNSFTKDYYQSFIKERNVKLVFGETYNLLQNSKVALVASGTASLEAAFLGVPQIVCYNTSAITYIIARFLIKIKYISLVNILLDKQVVVELIQQNLNRFNVKKNLHILLDENFSDKILIDYKKIKKIFGSSNASKNVSKYIISSLKEI